MAEPLPYPLIIYWVVSCPDCAAPAMSPCQVDGVDLVDDVHLGRSTFFAEARFYYPEMRFKGLAELVRRENQPE